MSMGKKIVLFIAGATMTTFDEVVKAIEEAIQSVENERKTVSKQIKR